MKIIIYFILSACFLSIIGSSYMVIMYFNTMIRNNFAMKLICYMAASDLIFSVSNIFYDLNGWECQVQAMMIQFSTLSSFIFCFILMVCTYLSVVRNVQNLQEHRIKFMLCGYLLPAIISVIPLYGNYYSDVEYVCGYDLNNWSTSFHHHILQVESIMFFYVPLWGFSFINIYLILRVGLFISQLRNEILDSHMSNQSSGQVAQEQELQFSQETILSLLAYPIIMIICWSGFTIYIICDACGYDINWLQEIRFVIPDCIGFLNSIVFVINNNKFKKWQISHRQDNKHHDMKTAFVKTSELESFRASFSNYTGSVGSFDDFE